MNGEPSRQFLCGTGTYLDSNAASYLRAIAYTENPKPEILAKGRQLAEFLGPGMRANPYLYLWESQRHWREETIQKCCESFAAVHALTLDAVVPDLDWGRRFRSQWRHEAESVAAAYLSEFQQQLDEGLSQAINDQVELVEAMLVRAKIIEYSSRKSSQHKLNELIKFMHEELATMMTRELIVCADILCHGRSRFTQKLNAVRNGPDPFGLLRNSAWDLFLPRALDKLIGATPVEGMDFYLPHIITFDEDVVDILALTELRSVALHRPSGNVHPFFDQDPMIWLSERVGEKRSEALKDLFDRSAYADRAARRSADSIRATLVADRQRLRLLLDSL
jgi:hypothetical protein